MLHGSNFRRMFQSVLLLLVVALISTACSSGTKEDTKSTKLSILLPFASGINFYPLYVAKDRGYFGQNISVAINAADGSGAALQQLLTGKADVCLCGPGTALRAVAKGEDLVSVYTLYQKNVFSLITSAGSKVQSVEQLRGKTIGVDARQGGAESWLIPLLTDAGLKIDKDYKVTAVGAGAAPITGFKKGTIDAYAGAFVDLAVLRLRGFELKTIELPGADVVFDSGVWMKRAFVEKNPKVVESLGRGMAMATEWGLQNPETVIKITKKTHVEEASDPQFALALLKETSLLFSLPEGADGKWGFTPPSRASALIDALVQQGAIPKGKVSPSVFTNRFVDAFNASNDVS